MKRDTLQNIFSFIFKYIWLFFVLLVILEVVFTVSTATVLMKDSSEGIIQSICGEVSGRVDGVLRLMQGLAVDENVADTSKPLFDRVIQTRPFQESYDLYMIAMTDEDVNVISADETEPPEKQTSLAYREYMQDLYKTGQYQITDAFLAGADGVTRNYTIAVPILKDGVVKGSVFGSIYFDDIKDIIQRNINNPDQGFYLLGKDNAIMAGEISELIDKSFIEATKDVHFINTNVEEVNKAIKNNQNQSNWEWEDGSLWYVNYQKVPPTEWTIVYRIRFTAILGNLLPSLLFKLAFYIVICALVYIFGPRFFKRQLADINHMLDRMTDLQSEIFQNEAETYDNLITLTKEGLKDHLTGLATRSVLIKRYNEFRDTKQTDFYGALFFIDLDDLKRINDTFGHEAGDTALLHIAETLKPYDKFDKGIAARYGGDEFILIAIGVREQEALKIANDISIKTAAIIDVKEHHIPIHTSIGISLFPTHGDSLEDMVCKADLALYAAKQQGKNRFELHSDNKIN